MRLFGNTKQSKYGKNADRAPAVDSEPKQEQTVQEISAPPQQSRPESTPSRLYDKSTSIFDYAHLEPAQRRQQMQRDYRATPVRERKKSKRKKGIRALIAILIVLALIAALWAFVVYTDNSFVSKWRDIWIQTAWGTMSHRWLATAFFPQSVIDKSIAKLEAVRQEQIGNNSTEPPVLDPQIVPDLTFSSDDPDMTGFEQSDPEKDYFYELFWELDEASAEAYFKQHPEVIKNGYSHICINEAGLNDKGTSIKTKQGEQVLAIDAENHALLVRIYLGGSRGVLAIGKDPSQLHLCPSSGLASGGYGQRIAAIAGNNNGLIAMTGSGFIDEGGGGNGGEIAGYCKCDGTSYGRHRGWGIKRIELKENNWMYITDAPYDCGDDVTDAVEFEPALVVNGQMLTVSDYTALQPRACIGQSKTGEILMVVVEGRFVDSPGCSVELIAKLMMEHNCQTAMNLDGGTSAIMWYDGEVVTRCSNTATPEGRYLPNAWVYTDNN